MTVIRIPENWTADQADAVFDLLSRLADAIWNHYDNAIVQQDLECLGHQDPHDDPWSDDEIPF